MLLEYLSIGAKVALVNPVELIIISIGMFIISILVWSFKWRTYENE